MNQSADKLKSYISRIEKLEEEKKNISDDINNVYKEAKSDGFDDTVLRVMIGDRKKDPQKLEEFKYIYETYMEAMKK